MKTQKKTIGILGGLSPVSTACYYSQITEIYNAQFGGLNYPRIVIYSPNMADIVEALRNNNHKEPLRIALNALMDMPSADVLVLASNTMHRVARQLKDLTETEIIDIRDVVAKYALEKGYHKVLLLGTEYTIKSSFYANRLKEHGLEVVLPTSEEAALLDKLVYGSLCRGICNQNEADLVARIIEDNAEREDFDAVVLACTEFSLLDIEVSVPLMDTTRLHVEAIVDAVIFE